MKTGIIDCLYSFADGSGTVKISNAESSEAMMKGLKLAYPASPFVHFKVVPLVKGFDNVINKMIATMEKRGVIVAMKKTNCCSKDSALN